MQMHNSPRRPETLLTYVPELNQLSFSAADPRANYEPVQISNRQMDRLAALYMQIGSSAVPVSEKDAADLVGLPFADFTKLTMTLTAKLPDGLFHKEWDDHPTI